MGNTLMSKEAVPTSCNELWGRDPVKSSNKTT
ncbi:hypothetical protein ISN45_At04g000180 [Arabidopsis thaliana x Arabidopsis arenosa]|uniref:Uncharacterized protein n=2 Tax=Arabidopsis TaxID=3701 RepID=A0A8T2EAL8_ARASU|nr:hypothetical protein ISN45_At04g000180 [Arabidopsis thaliana x Arabidopsis arenosa]KAG7619083.1 hypothetical protein ISN44_As04g000170 [Arabidopsis suecica]